MAVFSLVKEHVRNLQGKIAEEMLDDECGE
jgi:hypothetical protein